jgi:Na+/melibiose symporter-like transporter
MYIYIVYIHIYIVYISHNVPTVTFLSSIQSQLEQAVKALSCIQMMTSSNPGQDTG